MSPVHGIIISLTARLLRVSGRKTPKDPGTGQREGLRLPGRVGGKPPGLGIHDPPRSGLLAISKASLKRTHGGAVVMARPGQLAGPGGANVPADRGEDAPSPGPPRRGSATATRCCSTAAPPRWKWPGCWSGGPLQIVTNSLPIANLFASSRETDLVMLGGYVYPQDRRGPGAVDGAHDGRHPRAADDPQRAAASPPRGCSTATCCWSRPNGK